MRNITESMAGRAAVLQLLPMSARETPKVNLLHGGYPEMILVHRPARAELASHAVAPGVRAIPWREFVTGLV